MQAEMLERARTHREAHTYVAKDYEEFKKTAEEKPGFIKAMWCGCQECEDKIKEDTQATIRCVPFMFEQTPGVDMVSGKPATQRFIIARSY